VLLPDLGIAKMFLERKVNHVCGKLVNRSVDGRINAFQRRDILGGIFHVDCLKNYRLDLFEKRKLPLFVGVSRLYIVSIFPHEASAVCITFVSKHRSCCLCVHLPSPQSYEIIKLERHQLSVSVDDLKRNKKEEKREQVTKQCCY
jgi:hypothetical protein